MLLAKTCPLWRNLSNGPCLLPEMGPITLTTGDTMFTLGHRAIVLLVAGLAFTALNTASAAANGSKSGAPRNFRVTATTAYTVSLAWDAPTGSSGDFNYYLWGAYNVGPTVILPKTATSYTFTALYPGNSYTFGIYTKDARG